MSFMLLWVTFQTLLEFAPLVNTISYQNPLVRKPRIVGGTKVGSRMLYPFQVSVRYEKQHICGGTIIHSRFIVTAAHCAFNEEKLLDFKKFSIVVGDLNIYEKNNSTVHRRIWKWHQHPRYFSALIQNDIALLELSELLEENNFIKPITMAKSNPIPGKICIGSGWGIIKKDEALLIANPLLMEIKLFILPSRKCIQLLSWMTYDNSKICAFSTRGCPSLGDSGGPLICNEQLSGIISFGKIHQCVDAPNCFTSIQFHRKWIQYVITKSEYTRRYGEHLLFREILNFILELFSKLFSL